MTEDSLDSFRESTGSITETLPAMTTVVDLDKNILAILMMAYYILLSLHRMNKRFKFKVIYFRFCIARQDIEVSDHSDHS